MVNIMKVVQCKMKLENKLVVHMKLLILFVLLKNVKCTLIDVQEKSTTEYFRNAFSFKTFDVQIIQEVNPLDYLKHCVFVN